VAAVVVFHMDVLVAVVDYAVVLLVFSRNLLSMGLCNILVAVVD
jgi:hypothetical protein